MWILLFLLIALIVVTVPFWPYSRGWGFYPSVGLGLIAILVVVLLRFYLI